MIGSGKIISAVPEEIRMVIMIEDSHETTSEATRANLILICTLYMLIALCGVSALLIFLNMKEEIEDKLETMIGYYPMISVLCPTKFFAGEVATVQAEIANPYFKNRTIGMDVEFFSGQINDEPRNYLCDDQRLVLDSPEGKTVSCEFIVPENVHQLRVFVGADTDQHIPLTMYWGACRAPVVHPRNVLERIASYVEPGWVLIASLIGILNTGAALGIEKSRRKHAQSGMPPINAEISNDEPVKD